MKVGKLLKALFFSVYPVIPLIGVWLAVNLHLYSFKDNSLALVGYAVLLLVGAGVPVIAIACAALIHKEKHWWVWNICHTLVLVGIAIRPAGESWIRDIEIFLALAVWILIWMVIATEIIRAVSKRLKNSRRKRAEQKE